MPNTPMQISISFVESVTKEEKRGLFGRKKKKDDYESETHELLDPEEEYFYDNSMMEDLRDRISSECELTLHEAMRPSEVTFLVSLPRDSKGSIDYDAVKNKIEMIQNEDMPEIASSDSLSE